MTYPVVLIPSEEGLCSILPRASRIAGHRALTKQEALENIQDDPILEGTYLDARVRDS